MAFIVEDGTGLANATAYVGAAEFVAYWADEGVTFTQATAVVEQSIVHATRYIDRTNAGDWKGYLLVCSPTRQALAFPRTYVYDSEGVLLEGVPNLLKSAVFEYARRVLDGTSNLQPDPTGDTTVTSTTEEVGPIKESTTRIPGFLTIQPYPAADQLLSELVQGSSHGSTYR